MPGRVQLELTGAVVLVTGASRGIGAVIVEVLARRGAQLAIVARNRGELEGVAERARGLGAKVLAVPTDVGDAVLQAFGRIDVLINNAGIEQVAFYESLSVEEIARYVDVNLTAPLQLTRLVLPGMLARGRGHIVNMASVAGFGAAAFGETYGATKAGLVGFTRSLRASLKTLESPVSASVVCPVFVEGTGMFADLHSALGGEQAPAILGACTAQEVADAVLRAIALDEPERFVGKRRPLRLFFSVGLMFPRLLERLTHFFGVNAMYLRAARGQAQRRSQEAPRPAAELARDKSS